jgi:hypothetical protein
MKKLKVQCLSKDEGWLTVREDPIYAPKKQETPALTRAAVKEHKSRSYIQTN